MDVDKDTDKDTDVDADGNVDADADAGRHADGNADGNADGDADVDGDVDGDVDKDTPAMTLAVEHCETCRATGEPAKDTCDVCEGWGYVPRTVRQAFQTAVERREAKIRADGHLLSVVSREGAILGTTGSSTSRPERTHHTHVQALTVAEQQRCAAIWRDHLWETGS